MLTRKPNISSVGRNLVTRVIQLSSIHLGKLRKHNIHDLHLIVAVAYI